ncbi:MAG TPA: DUF2911 domain-containing protein, partial [Longimicrobiales bacterium]|nr:DUF2911 domain-containing protein [Longimicrobiales bacterium]
MPALLHAQVRASERATVSQVVDGTTITIDYARPLMRGRVPFPAVVKWNEVWTPGANWATTLAVSRDIELNGHPVAKGKYSVWMIPRESNEWTVLLDGNTRRFHTQKPDPAKAVLSFTVKPQQGPPVEALTWSFPGIARDGATLHMYWGTTYVPLQIAVTPTRPV